MNPSALAIHAGPVSGTGQRTLCHHTGKRLCVYMSWLVMMRYMCLMRSSRLRKNAHSGRGWLFRSEWVRRIR